MALRDGTVARLPCSPPTSNANRASMAHTKEGTMTNTNARGMTTLGAVALVVVLGACSDDRDAQARAAEGGMVVAAATPERPTIERELVTATVDSSPVEPARPIYPYISYRDAEAVFRKRRYGESVAMFCVYAGEHPDNAFGHYMHGLSSWNSGDHATAA